MTFPILKYLVAADPGPDRSFIERLFEYVHNTPPVHPLADLLGLDPLVFNAVAAVFFWGFLICMAVRAWRNRQPVNGGRR